MKHTVGEFRARPPPWKKIFGERLGGGWGGGLEKNHKCWIKAIFYVIIIVLMTTGEFAKRVRIN